MLKIGLMLDSVHSDKYVCELALWGKGQADIDISHLILHPRREETPLGKLKDLTGRGQLHLLPRKIVFRLLLWLERALLRWSDSHKDHYRSCDLSKVIDKVVEIRPIVSKSGYVYRFSDEDVETVKALGLDVLIRCGSGILRGDILQAGRLGVVSFHHGDNKVNRGGPAGFWECYYEWPQTGFIIQRLTEELDAGEVLVRGSFETRFYYSLNQAQLYKRSLTHLKWLLKKTASTGHLPAVDDSPTPYSNILFRSPTVIQCFVYGCKLMKRLSIKAITRILKLRERWGISVLPARWNNAVFWRSTKVSFPRGRFWADPFLHTRNGKTFCFVEDFVYRTGKAHITALEIDRTRVTEHGIALDEPFHLSFPFLFEYRGELYMCPEACESRQVRVYRCTDFPLKWKLERILMDGVSAADT